MDIQEFSIQQNGFRNAQYIMFAALVTKLAQERGEEAETWLAELRQLSLTELAAARMMNPADEGTPETLKVANIARSLITAAFDMADDRVRSSQTS